MQGVMVFAAWEVQGWKPWQWHYCQGQSCKPEKQGSNTPYGLGDQAFLDNPESDTYVQSSNFKALNRKRKSYIL